MFLTKVRRNTAKKKQKKTKKHKKNSREGGKTPFKNSWKELGGCQGQH